MRQTPIPILYANVETLSLRQLDELNGVPKGTSFRAFKACRATLVEGTDFFHLDAETHGQFIDSLREDERIYAGSRHLLLITRAGYERLR